jgi:ABC-type Na+ efflux pump permease subunit
MKILMWILIIGIPCIFVLNVAGIMMSIQHWPASRGLSTFAALMMFALLIIAWIFAFRFYKRKKHVDYYDSF